jgi:hypothetical protein
MTQYFFIDASGRKCGPCDEQLLKEFIEHGTIKPDTLLETDTGVSCAASEITGMLISGESPITTTPVPTWLLALSHRA